MDVFLLIDALLTTEIKKAVIVIIKEGITSC